MTRKEIHSISARGNIFLLRDIGEGKWYLYKILAGGFVRPRT